MTENKTSPTRPRPVDAIAEKYVAEYAALDPLTATYLGVDGHEDQLTDLSPDGFVAQQRLGDAFDLRAFHRTALDPGSIGLDPLRQALGRL